MSDSRALKEYFGWLESSQRFDYFVTGVALALVSYLASNLNLTRPLGFNSSGIELVTLGTFVLAAYLGLRRIESTIVMIQAGARKLDAGEGAGALMAAFHAGGHSLLETRGELVSAVQTAKLIPALKQTQLDAQTAEAKWAKCALHYYRWRNRMLVSGLLALIAAKLLRGYGY